MTEQLPCPTCPLCSQPPAVVVSDRQAFCRNPDCPAVCWDMTRSLAWHLTNATSIRLSDFLKEP